MAQLEGRQSILAALKARQRKFQVILIRHGTHAEGVDEVIATATELGVPIRYVDSRELESFTHGSSHGGIVAMCSAKPRTSLGDILEQLRTQSDPALLL